MIDTLLSNIKKINKSDILNRLSSKPGTCNLQPGAYSVLTLHRPNNVDSKESLSEIYNILESISKTTKIVYPIHPRTRRMLKVHNFLRKFEELNNLLMVGPLSYIDFVKLVKNSQLVLTDSGGIQEETTVLKVPCLTMRENTERPITIKKGTNCLVGRDKEKIMRCVDNILKGRIKKGAIPVFWDGYAAERIVKILVM
jgi:UDP-N-acetylglucosamine 2-epimerase (non-hydrolysing)